VFVYLYVFFAIVNPKCKDNLLIYLLIYLLASILFCFHLWHGRLTGLASGDNAAFNWVDF